VGLEAASYSALPASELDRPPLTHHTLILLFRPPDELNLRCEGVKRHLPPSVRSISVVPAGSRARRRWSGRMNTLHAYLEPGLVGRVAAEAFELDPARLRVPQLDGLDLPHLRAAMLAVDAKLNAGGAGGLPAAESLANVLAVHLIRQALAPRQLRRGPDGALPRRRLRAVVEYVEDQLGAGLTVEQMAAAAPTTSPGSSRRLLACRRTGSSSPAAWNGPGGCWNAIVSCRWRRSPPTLASVIRACSPITSSASSASRPGNSASPQGPHKVPQTAPRVQAQAL
jgi:hypothetical protein